KEISIRKVLGSTTRGIFFLLSQEYIRLILIANVIAIPLVWYGMTQWLDTFAFSIQISLWVFLIACVTTFAVAFLAVSYQSIKAAYTNPVKALRNE
ncbi:MAG: FtsX-like permease family protein, partial [Bacteroidetes bacterium]|nr:FtsX-like permease family protein [Bacteroidota bacterium]